MRRTWRNRWTFFGAIPLWVLSGFIMFMFGTRRENSAAELLAAAVMVTVVPYGASLVTMFSWVRLTPAALVVQNPGMRWTIPWSKVRGVSYEGGLEVDVKGRSEPIFSAAYQGSLLGRWAGWPSSRKAAEAIERYRREATEDDGDTEVRESFPWRAHGLWLGISWTIVAVLMPLLGRYAT